MTSTITDRVYGESASVAVKAPCLSVSVGAPLPLVGLGAVGSYTPSAGDRILVKDQTDPTANGIYNAAVGAWVRSGDFDGTYDAVQGTLIVVYSPNASGATMYQLTTMNPIIGTTPLNFSSFLNPTSLSFSPTQAELNQGFTTNTLAQSYIYGNVLRYLIVPNVPTAAASNTAILNQLASYSATGGGWRGKLTFPNTTGTDNYYFSDIFVLNDGVSMDLGSCTITFTKNGVNSDTNAGFLHCIRNNTIENGSIVVNYTYTTGSNTGNAIGLGGRDGPVAGSPLPTIFDSLLSSPMGNIVLRNLNITSNAGGAQARLIFSLGGLQNVLIENIVGNGQGVNLNGLYAEYGWATNEASTYLRQTSHPNNWTVKNFNITDVTLEGFSMNGGYGITIDQIRVYTAGSVVGFGMGEALFYRPWSGMDGAGSKHCIFVRNAVGGGITGAGFNFGGSTTLAGVNTSYLGGPGHNNPNGLTNANMVDLLEFTLENFAATGTVNNYGIVSTAGRATIRSGTLTGFQRGIVTSQECTNWLIEQVEVFNSTGIGMALGQAINTVYAPPRQATGKVTGCFVAGSGTAGTSAAINIGTTASARIEHCRFGYELIHDLVTETTQAQAVSANADAFGVICDDNYVAGTSGGAVAYNLAAGNTSRGCTVINDSYSAVWLALPGTKFQGIWENTLDNLSPDNGDANATYNPHAENKVQLFATTLTANRTLTLSTANANTGDKLRTVRSGLGAFTLTVGAKVLPSATAAWVDHEFNGAAWVETASGTL